MKILLTGASGFIGGHLLTQLTNNLGYDSVIALTTKEIPNKNCILYYLCTHLNLFSSKSVHPDLNSKLGLNEKTSVVFFFLPQ